MISKLYHYWITTYFSCLWLTMKKEDTWRDRRNQEKSSDQKITIFQSKVEISDQLEALAKEYTEETGVEVEIWGTTGDDYFQQLQIRLNSDQGPSIFSFSM